MFQQIRFPLHDRMECKNRDVMSDCVNGPPLTPTRCSLKDSYAASNLTFPTFENLPDQNAMQPFENPERYFPLKHVPAHFPLSLATKSLTGASVQSRSLAMAGMIQDYGCYYTYNNTRNSRRPPCQPDITGGGTTSQYRMFRFTTDKIIAGSRSPITNRLSIRGMDTAHIQWVKSR
jgi:hypothetical protein